MRMHVNLRVKDLEASARFYASLFGAEPAVKKHDYAKWMLEDPRVNFAIVATKDKSLGLEHLGIQAESLEQLAELRARAARTGARIEEEGETTCCYARSDKSWLTDQQGVEWEVFYTHGLVEDAPSAASAGSSQAACCVPACCSGGPPAASAPSAN